MSNEKPRAPFVTYHSDDTGNPDDIWSLRIGGVLVPTRFRLDPPDIGAEVEAAAADINAAIEAREAKLRGALSELLEAAYITSNASPVQRRLDSMTDDAELAITFTAEDLKQIRAAVAKTRDVLAGTGPDYVPEDVANALAFDLGQAQETIRKLALIHDSLDLERADRIAPFLEAMGLRKWGLESVSNEALNAELKRRKNLAEIEHVFGEHEYGYNERNMMVTGTSLCGQRLEWGGDWTAILQSTARERVELGHTSRMCHECIRALDGVSTSLPNLPSELRPGGGV